MNVRYPIAMDVSDWCHHEHKSTLHSCRIFPDTEYRTCLSCGTAKVLRYDREMGRELVEVDQQKVSRALEELNLVRAKLQTHRWSKNLGARDRDMVSRLQEGLAHLHELIQQLQPPTEEIDG